MKLFRVVTKTFELNSLKVDFPSIEKASYFLAVNARPVSARLNKR